MSNILESFQGGSESQASTHRKTQKERKKVFHTQQRGVVRKSVALPFPADDDGEEGEEAGQQRYADPDDAHGAVALWS